MSNSHICHWSPSFRVAIDWRRKGIEDSQNKIKNGHAPREPYHCHLAPQALVDSERNDSCR